MAHPLMFDFIFDILGETLSCLGATFAQAEEHARHTVSRAQRVAVQLTQEVSQMQAVAEEQLAGMASHRTQVRNAQAQATEALAAVEHAGRSLRALQAQADAAVDTWIAALEHARLRRESGRYELSQAQGMLAAAKAHVVARDGEHHTATLRALREGTAESPQNPSAAAGAPPQVNSGLAAAAAAREQARTLLRAAMGRLKSAHEQLALAERVLTRCQGGAERAVELARAAREAQLRASGALALAYESGELAGAALTQLLRSQPAVEACADRAGEAAAAAEALSGELTRSAALARSVSERQSERHALAGRGVVALEELLQSGGA